jgi:hypothetical protein
MLELAIALRKPEENAGSKNPARKPERRPASEIECERIARAIRQATESRQVGWQIVSGCIVLATGRRCGWKRVDPRRTHSKT